MPAFCSAYGCTSTAGRDDILAQPLSGNGTIGQAPGPSQCCKTDPDDVAADPVYDAAWGLTLQLGKAVETSPEPACELRHVTDKSVQVRLLIHHEASQANEKKILSTSATQTEPQAVSSGQDPVPIGNQRWSFRGVGSAALAVKARILQPLLQTRVAAG
ncbi:uncharacterized protein LOC125757269 isoform X3 [Rhipicephalus sanguineus]|uniref:uncharacterized protein LOC125757269 isoform X3 n=1 Tax=Rhipicephalus sanguineus TaxID=34632 RepID=UPI0020C398C4|nr:uncharacterized protein LOC125757269 isoform X3 [Rhipicephalus sanguineus]